MAKIFLKAQGHAGGGVMGGWLGQAKKCQATEDHEHEEEKPIQAFIEDQLCDRQCFRNFILSSKVVMIIK